MTNSENSAATVSAPVSEATDAGSQFVISGYQPVTQRERLERIALLPMQPKRHCQQKPCNIGLFDTDARNQLDLF